MTKETKQEKSNDTSFFSRWKSRRYSRTRLLPWIRDQTIFLDGVWGNMLYKSVKTLVFQTVRNVFVFKSRKYCSENSRKKWKIMFFGTDGFALKSLEELHKAM